MKFYKKADLYLRVSTSEQAKHGFSIDMQENQNRLFANKMGFEVKNVYIDDGYSGKSINRPKLNELLKNIKKRNYEIDAVIVWRCDRLSRNTDYYYGVIKPTFEKHGIQILSATEPNDMDNPYGRYMRNNQINNAELESGLISIRTIENLKEKARQGDYPSSIPPVGYKRERVNGKSIVVIDEEKAPYVERIFCYYITGFYSFKSLADKMSEEGFTHHGKKCTKKLIENILCNNLLFYTGKFKYMDKEYQGNHKPILTFEAYKEIQQIKKERSTTQKQVHNFLYKGMIKCPKSGNVLIPEKQSGQNKSGEYIYYRCQRHKCKGCKRIIKEEIITETVLDTLKSIQLTPAQIADAKEDFKTLLHIQSDMDDKRKLQIETQSKKLKNRLNQLYEDKLDGIISPEVYMQKKAEWENQLDDLTLQYTALMKTNRELTRRMDKLLELCESLSERYLELPDEKKRQLLKIICSNFFYSDSKLSINVKSAFAALFKFVIFENGSSGGTRTYNPSVNSRMLCH